MDALYSKLNLITEIWNSMFFEQTYAQSRINFNSEKATNYFGDIMHYFNDTFPILDEHKDLKNQTCKFHEYIFYNIGILQILYIQQDLIEEMINIFSLKKNRSKDFNHIRRLRNELTGHPISRDKDKKLKSSVFWLDNPPEKIDLSKIEYRRFEKGEWKNATQHSEDVDKLIENHRKYLNEYFDLILNKENEIITEFEKELKIIMEMTNSESVDRTCFFESAFELVSSLSTDSLYLSKEYVKKASSKIEKGERYKCYIEYCFEDVQKNIIDIIKTIESYRNEIHKALKSQDQKTVDEKVNLYNDEFPIIEFVCASPSLTKNNKKVRRSYSYELSKLGEKKYPDFIDLLISENNGNSSICRELGNMKTAYLNDDDFEYYTSFLYVSKLLSEL